MAAKQQRAERAAKSAAPSRQRPAGLPSYFSESDDDRLIYEKVRLGIVSALAINDRLSFSELKDLLSTSDGNLSVHARKLEDAQYIECEKAFSGRVPKTHYRLSAKGRSALDRYLEHMEALIRMARNT